MELVVSDIRILGISYNEAIEAFGRVWDGRVKSPGEPTDPEMDFDRDVHDEWILRLISQGRVVKRVRETDPGPHAIHFSLLFHPSLPEGTIYAIRHSRYNGFGNVYQCSEQDAIYALAYHQAYNL